MFTLFDLHYEGGIKGCVFNVQQYNILIFLLAKSNGQNTDFSFLLDLFSLNLVNCCIVEISDCNNFTSKRLLFTEQTTECYLVIKYFVLVP